MTRAFLTLVVFCAVIAGQVASAAGDQRARRKQAEGTWEVLGTRVVNDRLDHDTIPVTAAKGTFRSLKIRVEGHAVQFHDMKIRFGNGDTQDVDVRNVIPAGGESRVIDIAGPGDRVIKSIEFRYDAQTIRGRKATVRVLGRN